MVKAGGYGWGCVRLPLQSTKEKMHTIRTLGIGRHKQRAMGIYIDHSQLQEHLLANEQAGYHPQYQPCNMTMEYNGNGHIGTIVTIIWISNYCVKAYTMLTTTVTTMMLVVAIY